FQQGVSARGEIELPRPPPARRRGELAVGSQHDPLHLVRCNRWHRGKADSGAAVVATSAQQQRGKAGQAHPDSLATPPFAHARSFGTRVTPHLPAPIVKPIMLSRGAVLVLTPRESLDHAPGFSGTGRERRSEIGLVALRISCYCASIWPS